MNAPVKITPPPATFASAFVKLQAQIGPAIKGSINPAFKSKYADLGAVWDAVRGPLHDNGFAATQLVQYEGENVYLETILLHADFGPCLKSQYPLRPVRADPQGVGSAITYAKRYALCAMLGVIADIDDDGNAASERPANGNHKPSAPPPDDDIKNGVDNWVSKQALAIGGCKSLPDLIQWQDEQEDALNRLLKKYPEGHAKIMAVFHSRSKFINQQEQK